MTFPMNDDGLSSGLVHEQAPTGTRPDSCERNRVVRRGTRRKFSFVNRANYYADICAVSLKSISLPIKAIRASTISGASRE